MSFTTLMYHEIRQAKDFDAEHLSHIDVHQDYSPILPSPLFCTVENFRNQMEYLKKNNYHTLSPQEVIDYYYGNAQIPEKSILITFDDCFQSMKRYGYPILKEFGFHGLAFVVTGWLHLESKPFNRKRSVCLTRKDLEDMSDVFQYANHMDQFHIRLDSKSSLLITESEANISADLDRCNNNPIIQHKIIFAYPFGLYNENSVSILKKKDFLLAFTSNSGRNTKETDPLLLHRETIHYCLDIDMFKNIIGE